MSNNPFESIAEIYTEAVDKADGAGMSEVYKQATDRLFQELKNECGGLTITDVEYLDGYFIFGRGTNSIVHFHISETPGWKYGIWWEPVEDKDTGKPYTDRVHCSIFAQYEEEIDKFKPSASMVCEELTLYFQYPSTSRLWAFADDIKFIRDEPYLAFYREMHYTDFNREYISREEARTYYELHMMERKLEAEVKEANDKDILSTICEILKEDLEAGICFIQDHSESWSPRYEIIVKNLDDEGANGCYDVLDLIEEESVERAQGLWTAATNRCKERNKSLGRSWFSPCCDLIALVLPAENYDQLYASSKIVKV